MEWLQVTAQKSPYAVFNHHN